MVAANPEGQTGNKRVGGHGLYFWVVIPFPFILFALIWLIMTAIIHYWHFWVALPVALLVTVVVVGFIMGVYQFSWVEKFENPLPVVSLTGHLSACVAAALLLTTVGAWVSYVLCQYGISPSAKDSMPPTYNNLVSTYLWHLVDVVPLTNLEKTFGMKDPPVRFTGWFPGLPILVFRLFVIVVILAAVRLVWETFHKTSQEALVARLGLVAKSPTEPQKTQSQPKDVA